MAMPLKYLIVYQEGGASGGSQCPLVETSCEIGLLPWQEGPKINLKVVVTLVSGLFLLSCREERLKG